MSHDENVRNSPLLDVGEELTEPHVLPAVPALLAV